MESLSCTPGQPRQGSDLISPASLLNTLRSENPVFLVDWNNLFVSSTLHDELLLFAATPENTLQNLEKHCLDYGLQLEQHRKLISYSGGEQAIICCLFLGELLPDAPMNIVFLHVLETLSPSNASRILQHLRLRLPNATFYQTGPAGTELLA